MRSHAHNPLRTDFTRAVLDRADCGASRRDVRTLLDAIRAWMRQSLQTTRLFRLPGIFRAKVGLMAARPALVGRNPRTGELITIAPSPQKFVARLWVDVAWQRAVFASLPLKMDSAGQRVVIDHAHLKTAPIVAPSPTPIGLRALVKAVAPLFPRLTKTQVAALYLALRDEVAERVIVAGRCMIPGLAVVKFRGRKAVPEKQVRDPFKGEWATLPARPMKGGCKAALLKPERTIAVKTAR